MKEMPLMGPLQISSTAPPMPPGSLTAPTTLTGTIGTEIEVPSLPPLKLIKTKQGYGWIIGGDYSRGWIGSAFENM